jgi:adenylosuccinate synthase
MLLHNPARVADLLAVNSALFPFIDVTVLHEEVEQAKELLQQLVDDGYVQVDETSMMLNHARQENQRIMIECSQSALLGIDG